MEDSLFCDCYNLVDFVIPETVTYIGKEVFRGCSLENITIPSSVESIGEYAFGYCTGLHSVYCEPTTPPIAQFNWNWYAFDNNAEDRLIYVPAESVDAYKSATGWSDYADVIVGYNFETGEIVEHDNDITTAAELQAALDSAVEGENIITLAGDIVGVVTVSQQEGKNIIIDGAGHQFDGTMYIDGNSRKEGAETLLLKGIDFRTTQSSLDFISQNSTNYTASMYPHNVTIEECTFNGGSVAVGVRLNFAENITIKSCKVESGHSLTQLTACNNVVFDGVELNASRAVSLGASTGVVVNNCSFEATSYGLRAESNGNLVVNNSTIKASQPIIVHELGEGCSYAIDLVGVNTLIPTTDGDYQIIFTNDNYKNAYVEPLGEWSITGAEGYKIFPEVEETPVSGVEAVDLGLSVKWASCNVGANSPEEYGDYFAWGEIAPKDSYTVDNSLTSGKIIGDISGNPQYDAATANWGGSWRLPTFDEIRELNLKCSWEWVTQNGVDGMRVTGPNGNSIFLPAAGYKMNTLIIEEGQLGRYHNSTPEEGKEHHTYFLHIDESLNSYGYTGRSFGLSVRPVTE